MPSRSILPRAGIMAQQRPYPITLDAGGLPPTSPFARMIMGVGFGA
jgi:hypothetical protein